MYLPCSYCSGHSFTIQLSLGGVERHLLLKNRLRVSSPHTIPQVSVRFVQGYICISKTPIVARAVSQLSGLWEYFNQSIDYHLSSHYIKGIFFLHQLSPTSPGSSIATRFGLLYAGTRSSPPGMCLGSLVWFDQCS